MRNTEHRNKAILDEFDLEVESRCAEMESLAQRLMQNMRNEFRIQLMKLPSNIRRMPISEFCDNFNADINSVVNAEEIRAHNQASTKSAPAASATKRRPRKQATPMGDSQPFNLDALQGKGVEEQLAFLKQWQSQLDAFASQLKVAK